MRRHKLRRTRGSTLVTTLIMGGLATITGVAYLDIATQDMRTAAARWTR
jgi:Tfp pilus assembly protein PilX